MWRVAARGASGLMVCLTVGGCSLLFGKQIPTEVFVLTQNGTPPVVASDQALRVGVGPLRMPGYLDRPEMVVRIEANQVAPVPGARWGEPLAKSVLTIFGDDLGFRVGASEVLLFPWWTNQRIDYKVSVEVIRFEAEAGSSASALAADGAPAEGNVRLWARWWVDPGAVGAPDFGSEYDRRRPVAVTDGDAIARTMSVLLDDLATEIASAIGGHKVGRSPASAGPGPS